MPLEQSSSKEAFQHNIAAEIDAGKSRSQAAAISYSIQRANDEIPEYCMDYLSTIPQSMRATDILAKSKTYGG